MCDKIKFAKAWILPLIIYISAVLAFSGCGSKEVETMENTVQVITAEDAMEIMNNQSDYVILDVRNQDEFNEGHIKGAVLIPVDEIEQRAEAELTDKNQLILVYCRSGRRSNIAANQLLTLGYTNVKDFGGIIDWHYKTTVD